MIENRERDRTIIFLVSVLIGGIIGITAAVCGINDCVSSQMLKNDRHVVSELCEKLKSYDASEVAFGNMFESYVDVSDMFEQCDDTFVNLSSFDTSRVIDMSEIFERAEAY